MLQYIQQQTNRHNVTVTRVTKGGVVAMNDSTVSLWANAANTMALLSTSTLEIRKFYSTEQRLETRPPVEMRTILSVLFVCFLAHDATIPSSKWFHTPLAHFVHYCTNLGAVQGRGERAFVRARLRTCVIRRNRVGLLQHNNIYGS